MSTLIKYLQARMKTVILVCFVALALIAGASLLIDTQNAHSWVEQHVPFFWSFFGFGAATIIIGLTSWLGRSGIQAPTDFYSRSHPTTCEEEE